MLLRNESCFISIGSKEQQSAAIPAVPAPVPPVVANDVPAPVPPVVANDVPAPVPPVVANDVPAPVPPVVANDVPAPVPPHSARHPLQAARAQALLVWQLIAVLCYQSK